MDCWIWGTVVLMALNNISPNRNVQTTSTTAVGTEMVGIDRVFIGLGASGVGFDKEIDRLVLPCGSSPDAPVGSGGHNVHRH